MSVRYGAIKMTANIIIIINNSIHVASTSSEKLC